MQDIIVGLIVAVAIVLVVVKIIRDKKKGRSSCGGGCSGCAMYGTCHKPEKKE